MNEKIGNVTLNYEFYKGTDTYSDGDVEDTILSIVKDNSYEQIEELLTKENEWPILYHLSPIRQNILRWYDFNPQGSLLEIGAGCGAITGLFCEKTDRVVAIDLSKRRSTINAYRNKEYDNLEIMVGNFEDIRLAEKFDYVTLIGVLEYSIYYINSKDPFRDMLRRVKQFLKPGGKLIVAIENKYGLKYWAGAKEDHTGRNFDGIEGYHDVEKVRTFSRNTLENLLKDAGFEDNRFYYPLPDYKLPLEVYSDEYLPGKGAQREMSPSYDQGRMAYFNEVAAFDSLCEDGLFEQFANSFLVISE
jgi:SAM-dependent methyltransferase